MRLNIMGHIFREKGMGQPEQQQRFIVHNSFIHDTGTFDNFDYNLDFALKNE
jgi:hypothetical protein